MYARKRWRRGPARTGRIIWQGKPGGTISFDSSSEYMEDIVGNPTGDNNMYSTQTFPTSGVINFSRENRTLGGVFKHYSSWINFPYDNRDATNDAPLPNTWAGLPTDVSAATEAASRSNPSSPGVDLPLFLFELKDFPDMIRQTGIQLLGRRKPTHVRNNLNNEFGWAPLIGDLSKLLQFQDLVEKRISTLKDLHEGKSIRRNVTVFSDSYTVTQTGKSLYAAFLESLSGDVTTRVSVKKWASIKWIPPSRPPELQRDIHREAVQLVLGLRLRPRLLWDAMPWSWLVDWYSNIGDYIQATDNTYATFASACVMEMYTSDTTIIPTGGSMVKGATRGRIRRSTKSRRANIPISLTAESPLLGAKQLSILFQLANNYKK